MMKKQTLFVVCAALLLSMSVGVKIITVKTFPDVHVPEKNASFQRIATSSSGDVSFTGYANHSGSLQSVGVMASWNPNTGLGTSKTFTVSVPNYSNCQTYQTGYLDNSKFSDFTYLSFFCSPNANAETKQTFLVKLDKNYAVVDALSIEFDMSTSGNVSTDFYFLETSIVVSLGSASEGGKFVVINGDFTMRYEVMQASQLPVGAIEVPESDAVILLTTDQGNSFVNAVMYDVFGNELQQGSYAISGVTPGFGVAGDTFVLCSSTDKNVDIQTVRISLKTFEVVAAESIMGVNDRIFCLAAGNTVAVAAFTDLNPYHGWIFDEQSSKQDSFIYQNDSNGFDLHYATSTISADGKFLFSVGVNGLGNVNAFLALCLDEDSTEFGTLTNEIKSSTVSTLPTKIDYDMTPFPRGDSFQNLGPNSVNIVDYSTSNNIALVSETPFLAWD